MPSKSEALRDRSKLFAYRIVRLFRPLPNTGEAQVIGRQLLRSGTSVAANYRSACRARSKREFASKIGLVVEEIDESVFWLEMMIDCEIMTEKQIGDLCKEANDLLAIFAASHRTVLASLRKDVSAHSRLNGSVTQ